MNKKPISWMVAILIACILIYTLISLATPKHEERLRYDCYYIRDNSKLCLGGGQIKRNISGLECENLRRIGEKYSKECLSGFEWSIKEVEK